MNKKPRIYLKLLEIGKQNYLFQLLLCLLKIMNILPCAGHLFLQLLNLKLQSLYLAIDCLLGLVLQLIKICIVICILNVNLQNSLPENMCLHATFDLLTYLIFNLILLLDPSSKFLILELKVPNIPFDVMIPLLPLLWLNLKPLAALVGADWMTSWSLLVDKLHYVICRHCLGFCCYFWSFFSSFPLWWIVDMTFKFMSLFLWKLEWPVESDISSFVQCENLQGSDLLVMWIIREDQKIIILSGCKPSNIPKNKHNE